MSGKILINEREISTGKPVYIVAEISANHNNEFNKAVRLIEAAHRSGADAVKLQTYTPDTLTIDSHQDWFKIKHTIWKGKTLYQLYEEAYTPWEWQPKLKKMADKIGIDLFSTPFDPSSVEFLESMNVPAYKVASFELVDIPLLQCIAKTGKPIIMSTGMATIEEIRTAVCELRKHGCSHIALLKCTSAYPAPSEEANLKTIPHLAETFKTVAGLSDHTMGSVSAIAAVALGASIIEKHFCLSRKEDGPDTSFSMEPDEFRQMVTDIRTAEKAIGTVSYDLTFNQKKSKTFRRSLFAVKDVSKGEPFTAENIRSIRPSNGLPPKYFYKILGKTASHSILRGTPLSWDLID